MKHYKIYANSTDDYQVIKQGVSWPAFFFTYFWAISKRMWKLVLTTIYVVIILNILTSFFQTPPSLSVVIQLLIQFTFGSYGNKWREDFLKSSGYVYLDTSYAKNASNALIQYKSKLGKISEPK